jgi:hypothetical protein
MLRYLSRFMPQWLGHYPKQHLPSDVLAGVVTAVLVLPQNLAYALLAGLPPQAGLWASTLPVIAYALWGSSMTQAVGPVAVTAIVTFSVLSPLAAPFSAQYVALAATLALFSGLLVWLFGMFKLGFLSDLLSRPVVSGFISGAAVLIVISQLKVLLGLDVHAQDMWHLLIATLQSLPQLKPSTALIGLASLALLLFSKYFLGTLLARLGVAQPRADFAVRLMPLAAVLLATLVLMGFDLDTRYGVAVVGAIGQGGAGLGLFVPDASYLSLLALSALSVAFIGTVQNIGMAQALAVKRRERMDANQEQHGGGVLRGHARGRWHIAHGSECGGWRANATGQCGGRLGHVAYFAGGHGRFCAHAAGGVGGQHHGGGAEHGRPRCAAPRVALRPGRWRCTGGHRAGRAGAGFAVGHCAGHWVLAGRAFVPRQHAAHSGDGAHSGHRALSQHRAPWRANSARCRVLAGG